MAEEYSKYSLAKTKEILSKDEVFQKIVVKEYLEVKWEELNYTPEERANSYDNFVRFLLENRINISETDIEVSIKDENQTLRTQMLISFTAEGRAINDFGFIPQKVFRQILYSFKYSTIKKFFKENWHKFVPDFDVLTIKNSDQLEVFQEALMQEFDRLAETIDEIYNVVDVDKIPDKYLNYLAQAIGYEREDENFLYNASFRELIKNIIEIYKIKGTNFSFELFFNFLGFEVNVNEFWFDKRFSDPNISINEYTAVSDRNNFGFYLTTIKPTEYIPSGMRNPYAVTEEEIIGTLDGNEFNRTLAITDTTAEQILGIEPGYTGTPYTYFKTNIMEFTLERISENPKDTGEATANEDEETAEGGLSAEDIEIIRLYANFLTPIFISRNIVVVTAPIESFAQTYLTLSDNPRTDPRAIENGVGWNPQQTFLHLYAGVAPTEFYWEDGVRFYRDDYNINYWDVNEAYDLARLVRIDNNNDYTMFKCRVPHTPSSLDRTIYDINQIDKWEVDEDYSVDISTIPAWDQNASSYSLGYLVKVTDEYGVTTVYKCVQSHTPLNQSINIFDPNQREKWELVFLNPGVYNIGNNYIDTYNKVFNEENPNSIYNKIYNFTLLEITGDFIAGSDKVEVSLADYNLVKERIEKDYIIRTEAISGVIEKAIIKSIYIDTINSKYILVMSKNAQSTTTDTLTIKRSHSYITQKISNYNSGININTTGDFTAGSNTVTNVSNIDEIEEGFILKDFEAESTFFYSFSFESSTASGPNVITITQPKGTTSFNKLEVGQTVEEIAGVIPASTTITNVSSTINKQTIGTEIQIEKNDEDSTVIEYVTFYSIEITLSNNLLSDYSGTLTVASNSQVEDVYILSVNTESNSFQVSRNAFETQTDATLNIYGDLWKKFGVPFRDLIYPLYDKEGDFNQPDAKNNTRDFLGEESQIKFSTNYSVIDSIDIEGYILANTNEIIVTSDNYEKVRRDWPFRDYIYIVPKIEGAIEESFVQYFYIDDNIDTNNPNDDLKKIVISNEFTADLTQGNNTFTVGELLYSRIEREFNNFGTATIYPVDGILNESVVTNISFDSGTKTGTITIDNNALVTRSNVILRVSSSSLIDTEIQKISFYYFKTGRKKFYNWSDKFSYNLYSSYLAGDNTKFKVKEIIDDNGQGNGEIVVYDPTYRLSNFKENDILSRNYFNGDFTSGSNIINVNSYRKNLEFLNIQYFILEGDDGTFHYFWFNVNSGATEPTVTISGVSSSNIFGHEIVINNNLISANDVANLITNELDSISSLNYALRDNTITITQGSANTEGAGSFGPNIIFEENNITIINKDNKPFLKDVRKGDKVILTSGNVFDKPDSSTSSKTEIIEVNRSQNTIVVADTPVNTQAGEDFIVIKNQIEDRLAGRFIKGSKVIADINFNTDVAPEFIGQAENPSGVQYYVGDLVRSGEGVFDDTVYICTEDFNSVSVNTVTQALDYFEVINPMSFIRPGMKLRLSNDLFDFDVVYVDYSNKSITLDREYGLTGVYDFRLEKESFNFIQVSNSLSLLNDGVYNVEDISMEQDSSLNQVNLARIKTTKTMSQNQSVAGGFVYRYNPFKKMGDGIPYLFNEIYNKNNIIGTSRTTQEDIGYIMNDRYKIDLTGDFVNGRNEVIITSGDEQLKELNKNQYFFAGLNEIVPVKTNVLFSLPKRTKINIKSFSSSSEELNENYVTIQNTTDNKLYNFWFNVDSGTNYTKPRMLPFEVNDVISVEVSATSYINSFEALTDLRDAINGISGFNAYVEGSNLFVENDIVTDFFLVKYSGSLISAEKDEKSSIYLNNPAISTQSGVSFTLYSKKRIFTTTRPYLIHATGMFDYSTNEVIITSNNFDEIMYAFDNYDSLKVVDNVELRNNEEQLFETVYDTLEMEVSRKGKVFYYNDPKTEETDLISKEDINNSRFDIASYNRISTSTQEKNSIFLDTNANALGEYNFFIEVYDTEGVKPKAIDYYMTGSNTDDWPNNGKLEEVNIGGFSKTAMYELLNFFEGFDETLEESSVTKSFSNTMQRYNTFGEIAFQQFEISGMYNTNFDADTNTYETRHTFNFLGADSTDIEFYQEYLDIISIDYT